MWNKNLFWYENIQNTVARTDLRRILCIARRSPFVLGACLSLRTLYTAAHVF